MPVLFQPFPKQQEFIDAVFSGKYRYLFFGGAAGGGKSIVLTGTLILLCKIFPNSKWHVIRRDSTKLQKTSIPTFNKIVPRNFLVKFVDQVAYFNNGSQIHFVPENFIHDKDLNWMDGLETNGFILEEVQELQEATFNKAKLRAGRNIIDPMPPILLLCSGNPSLTWSKRVFVEPHREGKLEAPYYFLQSLMTDNPSLTKEYIEGMKTLDSMTYRRYVQGDWDVIDVDRPFAYAFSMERHVKKLPKPSKKLPVYLSFDFNVDPITCIAVQTNLKDWIRVHKEYRLTNSDIYKLCAEIKRDLGEYYFYVTGDASGTNRSALTKDNANYYTVIINQLGISPNQLKLPNANPLIADNRVLINSLLERFPEISFDPDLCPFLIQDLIRCEVNGFGELDKTKDKHRGHLLDGWRYHCNTWHSEFVRYRF